MNQKVRNAKKMDCYKPYIGYLNKCDTKIIKIKKRLLSLV